MTDEERIGDGEVITTSGDVSTITEESIDVVEESVDTVVSDEEKPYEDVSNVDTAALTTVDTTSGDVMGHIEVLEAEDEPESKGFKKRMRTTSKRPKRIKKKATKAKPDKPYDPDAFSERYRRWKAIWFGGYVILRTLSRDARTQEYLCESTLVKWTDLPHDAVHCTGEKHVYCLDKITRSDYYMTVKAYMTRQASLDGGFTASDAALFMQTNKFDNALTTKWNASSHVDFKMIGIVAACILGVILMVMII